MPIWLIQLISVALKEVRQTLRDRRMLALLLVAPVFQLGVFGLAVDFDVDRVPTVIVDHDDTEASRAAVERLLADRTLLGVGSLRSESAAVRAIDRGDVLAAVIVPVGFARNLARGHEARLQVVVDGTDPNRGNVAVSAVSRWARSETASLLSESLPRQLANKATDPALAGTPLVVRRPARVEFQPRVLHNPRLKTAVYVVPGIAAMILLIVTMVVTAMGLARERENGTLEQVMVTPLTPAVLLIGKLLPYLFIGLFDWGLTLAVGAYAFGVPLRGNLLFLLLATLAYLNSTLGVGLFVSTVSGNQQQAFVGSILFMLPAVLLSGIMTPILGMPDWLRPLTYLNPVRYYAEIQRGVLLRDAGPADLWFQMVALVTIGVLVLAVAAWRFRRKLA